MVRFLGVERKSGTYEGRAYDNFVPHFVTDERSGSWVAGDLSFSLKVKAAVWEEVFDRSLKPGMLCDIQYNRYGQVMSIKSVKDPDTVMRK